MLREPRVCMSIYWGSLGFARAYVGGAWGLQEHVLGEPRVCKSIGPSCIALEKYKSIPGHLMYDSPLKGQWLKRHAMAETLSTKF